MAISGALAETNGIANDAPPACWARIRLRRAGIIDSAAAENGPISTIAQMTP